MDYAIGLYRSIDISLFGDFLHRIVTDLNNDQYELFKSYCENNKLSKWKAVRVAVLKLMGEA